MAIAQPWSESGPSDDEYLIEFELEARVLTTIESQPTREWRISEILDEAKITYRANVALIFLRLFREGLIERLGPARYRCASGTPSEVAKRNYRTFDEGFGPAE